jgi:hypothetical protein
MSAKIGKAARPGDKVLTEFLHFDLDKARRAGPTNCNDCENNVVTKKGLGNTASYVAGRHKNDGRLV